MSKLVSVVRTGRFAAHVVRALPRQDQQLPLPGGMMHPGINDQRGEDCGSFTLIRGKERGRTHSEAMLSSLVHAFRQSSVKNPQKDTSVWITTPPTRLIFGPYILPPSVSSPLPLLCLFPLHYSTSCLCCFCSASLPSLSVFPFSPLFYSWSHSPLPSHGPFHPSGLFSLSLRFPSSSRVFNFLCILSVCH